MKAKSIWLILTGMVLCFACLNIQERTSMAARTPKSNTSKTRAPVIFMAGDSTMESYRIIPARPLRGWGQMFHMYFKDGATVDNHGASGRSSKSFRDEGLWKRIMDNLRPGDYVIIQFGHNDKKGDPARHTEPFGTYKENLARFVKEVRAKRGKPILATSIVRRYFDEKGKLQDSHGDYIVAVRRLAKEQNVPLLDLEKRSRKLVQNMGPEHSKKLYQWADPKEYAGLPEGIKDDTHLNAYGASRICDLAVEEIQKNAPDLAKWLSR
ncbi:MAG: rhamnogalacturonan acetylesterase [Phycisphaerae bacterium]|nr:rhamnogalacturonan acetylesterase [Phycisphaerae bacterium]